MNIRATSTFRPGNFAALEAALLPKITEGVTVATNIVLDISQVMVPEDTGDLKASGKVEVERLARSVVGYVVYTMPYSSFVEFGTGRSGAASAGAGPYDYDMNWPGMV